MTAKEQQDYLRGQDALNQKLKGLEYLITNTPKNQLVSVPVDIQKALGLPPTIQGGDTYGLMTAMDQLNYQTGQLDYQGKQLDLAKARGELGLVSVISGQSGNRPDRNNNPGNLKVGGETDKGGFTIFETPEAGFQAMVQDITAKLTGNSPATRAKLGRNAETLLDVISVYAPEGDGNDPVNYAKSVASQLGINNINVSVGELLPKVQELAKAMAKHEGFTGDIMLGTSASDLSVEDQLTVDRVLAKFGTKAERDDNRQRITELINKGITDETELNKLVHGTELTPDKLKLVNTLGDDLRNNQLYKDITQVKNGYLNLLSGRKGDNAQGDLAIVYGFNKMLDPNSVVREGEFQMTQDTQSFFQKLFNYPKQIMQGDRLVPEVRDMFLKQGADLYDMKVDDFNGSVAKRFKENAKVIGVDYGLIGEDFKKASEYEKDVNNIVNNLSEEDQLLMNKYGLN
jgi:hypothetical protein